MQLRCIVLWLGLLASLTSARAEAARLATALASRFEGDRTGVCLVAVRIHGS